MTAVTTYERVGGESFFEGLTQRFYAAVRTDPVLRPLYPEDDAEFEASRVHLCLFLIQYWGGPAAYNELRGHPRLRMRHAPFVIGQVERDAWVRHMTDALDGGQIGIMERTQMLAYFEAAATAMMNA